MSVVAGRRPPVMRVAWVMAAGAVVSGLDASLANVGLDRIAVALHTDLATVQWVTTGFLLAFAVSVPVSGWLGRRFGAGRLWLGALTSFTVTSGVCAAVPDVGGLIGARVAQGLAAGLLIPAGQTTIGELAEPGELGRVMATVGIAVSIAPALGPVAGGLLLQAGSWRWLFLVNLPIGALGLAAGLRLVPRTAPAALPPALDWRGLALVSAGLPLVVLGVTDVGTAPTVLAPEVCVPVVAGVVCLAAFARSSRRRPGPLIDLRLFGRASFTAPVAAATTAGALIFGAGLLLPLYFQIVEHRSPIGAGLCLLAQAGSMAVVSRPAGLLTDRFGPGPVAVAGAGTALVAAVALAIIGPHGRSASVLGLSALLGVGTALAGIPPTVAAYRSVATAQLPDATTTVNVLQRVTGALAGAVFAAAVSRGLPDAGVAFRNAFVCLAVGCALALAAALAMWRVASR